MNIYLTIMVTVLVISQIVRCAQNHIHLKRQMTLLEKQLGQIDDITQEDLDLQKETYRLLHDWLKEETE